MFTANRLGPLESQQEVSELLVNVIDAIANKPENLNRFGDALSMVQTGTAHESLKGDYAESNQYLMYLPRKRAEGMQNIHMYGRTQIRWKRFNTSAISALQVYNEAVSKMYSVWVQENPLSDASVALEQIKGQNRGDPNRREQVLSQCGIIIQMLKARINESYWEYLMSTSWRFNFGVSNRDILSVIEGIRNSVANPNAEVNEDAGGNNREKAENDLKELKLPVLIQIKHYEMKRVLESFIENIRRTSSVWTDSQIIKLILTKLEQDNIFKDIERLWNTDQRFNACESFELFWKILECEFNLFAASSNGKEWLKNWQGPIEVNHTSSSSSSSAQSKSQSPSGFGGSVSVFGGGGGGSMSSRAANSISGSFPRKKDPILDKFENIQSCHDHLRYKFNESSTPCARGDKCRYVHWEDSRQDRSSAEVQGDRAKSAFIKSKEWADKRKREENGDRVQAKQLFKQFKAAEKGNNQPSKVFAAIEEEEFEAFFMELQKEEEEN